MTLLELCEPLFQYVCRLNRMARKGSATDYPTARADIGSIFEKMEASTRGDVALAEQYRKVELPLLFFVDSMIAESALPFASEWSRNRLGAARKELAGDEKFFDLLDEALQDNREGADERLAVYYTCLGLGFTGWYADQPEYLRRKMSELTPRVRAWVDADESAQITPDAYGHTNTTNLPLPVSSSLVPMLIIVLGLLTVVGVANYYLFKSSSEELNTSLDKIIARDTNPAK